MVSPTPHHPKVVFLLIVKAPFPPPDIEASFNVRKRCGDPGWDRPPGGGTGNLNMQSFSLNGGGSGQRDGVGVDRRGD